MERHICGSCGLEFGTEAEYLAHKCKKTGFKPTQMGHLGDEFKAISDSAIARGQAKK
jgi:hypothetical protein